MLIATTLCLVYPSKNCLGVELEQVKLDLSALNRLKQQDLQRIQRRTAIIAHFEARLENCGTYPHFERHATAAATACLTPELLAHLSQVYSGAKKFQADFIKKNADIDCGSDKEQKWLQRVKKDIDDQVEEIAQMCRQCLSLLQC